MSLLSYIELVELVNAGVIDAPIENINAASIDVRLGNIIVVESFQDKFTTVDIDKREVFDSIEVDISVDGYYDLHPNEFILAHTVETFNFPNNICAEFKLKSSGARTGLDNALATWCDCGWSGSVLTLELKNLLRKNRLRITPGMKIGQVIFFKVKEVPEKHSYLVKGRYNNDKSAQIVKK